MAIDTARYEQLKKEHDDAQREMDRAIGRRDQLIRELKTTYGCNTLAEMRAHVQKLEAAATEAEEKFNTDLAAFEAEWSETMESQK